MGFLRDRSQGEEGADFVREIFESAGLDVQRNDSRSLSTLKLWDFRLSGPLTAHIETKHDLREASTGNLAVEFFNPRSAKQSGLTATTASLWVVVLRQPRSAWIASVSELRYWVECTEPTRTVERAGDGNASIRLFPNWQILPGVFHRLDGLSPPECLALLRGLLHD